MKNTKILILTLLICIIIPIGYAVTNVFISKVQAQQIVTEAQENLSNHAICYVNRPNMEYKFKLQYKGIADEYLTDNIKELITNYTIREITNSEKLELDCNNIFCVENNGELFALTLIPETQQPVVVKINIQEQTVENGYYVEENIWQHIVNQISKMPETTEA